MVDLHVHLIAEDPARGNFLSEKKKRSLIGRYIRRQVGHDGTGHIEDHYVARLISFLRDPASPVTHAVLLGMDAVHDADGTRRLDRTDIAMSNDYLLALGREYPEFIPAISIHPLRTDAITELERLHDAGARVMKWLPNSQDFDPADPRVRPFLRRVGQLGIHVISHTGYEHTIKPHRQDVGDPARLTPGLEEGVRFIAAHSGSSGVMHRHEYFEVFLDMLGRHPHLKGDLSAFTSLARFPYLKRLIDGGRHWDRLGHGSDYPIPPNPWLFAERYGLAEALRLSRIANPLHRDVAIKRALGVPESVFENGGRWLGLA